MSRKPQGTSIIEALPVDRRECIEKWLFDENRTYAGVVESCDKQWGVKVSVGMVSRHYHRVAPFRGPDRVTRCAKLASELQKKFDENPTDYYRLLDNMVGQIAFECAVDSEENPLDKRVLVQFVKLLLDGRKYSLAREKWEFDAADACRKHLPEIQGIEADTSLDDDDKLNRIRLRLFGCAPK
jgi:hypothetical protein